jgi:hypothetical protein
MPASNYRKPPVQHQFKKGQSGNPKGRPKKKPNPGAATGGGTNDRFATIALDEATRPITVREGDRLTLMPAIQAVIRSMFRIAAQGDVRTQRQLVDLIARAESDRAALAKTNLEEAINYKRDAEEVMRQRQLEGLPPPEIFPHPEDVIINVRTGEVTIDGPLTRDQAGAQKAFLGISIKEMRRFFDVAAALAKDPANKTLKKEMEELQKYMRFIEWDSERRARHEAHRLSLKALENDSEGET